MSAVVIVDPERLHEAPAAFREYVARYFKKTRVLGREVLVAATKLGWRWEDEQRADRASGKGLAPGHSVEVDAHKGGLPNGTTLSEWMRKNERAGYFTELYAVDDFDREGGEDD